MRHKALNDLVLLVRGGRHSLDPERVRTAARAAHASLGLLAISVFADLDRDLEQLCRHRRALRVYGTLWTTTAGRLRAARFTGEQTGRDASHYSIILPDLEPPTLDRLRGCFAMRPNPLSPDERRRL